MMTLHPVPLARSFRVLCLLDEPGQYHVDLSAWPRMGTCRDGLRARPACVRAKARDGVQEIYAQGFCPVPEDG
jgi:glutathione S-transferase